LFLGVDGRNDVLVYAPDSMPYGIYASCIEWKAGWPTVIDCETENNFADLRETLLKGRPVVQVLE